MFTNKIQKIIFKHKLSDKLYHIGYSIDNDFTFRAGQYMGIQTETGYRRAYSILSASDGIIEFLIDTTPGGRASIYFENCKVGDENLIIGPYGKFFLNENDENPKYLICTGTGIVPFLSWLRNQSENTKYNFYIIYGIKTLKDDLVMKFVNKFSNINIVHCVTRQSKPETYTNDFVHSTFYSGRVTNYLKDFNVNSGEFYVCGADNMVADVKTVLSQNGVATIYSEGYG
jgi:NAD(P)H-flavin reductase